MVSLEIILAQNQLDKHMPSKCKCGASMGLRRETPTGRATLRASSSSSLEVRSLNIKSLTMPCRSSCWSSRSLMVVLSAFLSFSISSISATHCFSNSKVCFYASFFFCFCNVISGAFFPSFTNETHAFRSNPQHTSLFYKEVNICDTIDWNFYENVQSSEILNKGIYCAASQYSWELATKERVQKDLMFFYHFLLLALLLALQGCMVFSFAC